MSKFEYWSLNIKDWCISLLLSALVFTYILCYDFFWILLSLIKPEGKKLYRVSHQFGPNLNWGFFSTGPPQPLEHIPWISIGSFSPLILQRKKCSWVPVQEQNLVLEMIFDLWKKAQFLPLEKFRKMMLKLGPLMGHPVFQLPTDVVFDCTARTIQN